MTRNSELQSLVIWGASGHARVVADIVRIRGVFRIVGFLDDVNPDRRGTAFCGAPILGGREQLDILRNQGVQYILLGIGDCSTRLSLTGLLQANGFLLPVAVHPRAILAEDVVVGSGTIIAAGAVVNPGVVLGRSVIINTSASVDHECTIGDAAHVCPGAHLAGRVDVGIAVQIGIGATVIERVRIGARAIVGAGAVVVRDVPDDVIVVGVPAKIRRTTKR